MINYSQLFRTYTTKDKNGNTIDIFSTQSDIEVFQNIYKHSFKEVTPSTTLEINATHTVAQLTDHWSSKDVVVSYEKIEKTPVSTKKFSASFYFKCNEFESALDLLK